MPFEQKDNSGALFINSRKTEDRHPSMTGKCLIDGVEYQIAGWTKYSQKTGDKFLSLAFTRADEERERRGSRQRDEGPVRPEDDDEIPF